MLQQLIQERKFAETSQMKLVYENQAALHIAYNSVFHERTKDVEVNSHFYNDKGAFWVSCHTCINTKDQVADIIKSLRGPQIEFIYTKLGVCNLQ